MTFDPAWISSAMEEIARSAGSVERPAGFRAYAGRALVQCKELRDSVNQEPQGLLTPENVQLLSTIVVEAFAVWGYCREDGDHFGALDWLVPHMIEDPHTEFHTLQVWGAIEPGVGPATGLLGSAVCLLAAVNMRAPEDQPDGAPFEIPLPDVNLDRLVLALFVHAAALAQAVSSERARAIASMEGVLGAVRAMAALHPRVTLSLDRPVTGAEIYRVVPGVPGRIAGLTPEGEPKVTCDGEKLARTLENAIADGDLLPDFFTISAVFEPETSEVGS